MTNPNPLSGENADWTCDPATDRQRLVARALAADFARTLDATKSSDRHPAMADPGPGSTTSQPTPLTVGPAPTGRSRRRLSTVWTACVDKVRRHR